MFPIRDHNPSGGTPYVTWTLIAVNILIFIGYWTTATSDVVLSRVFFDWGLVPRLSGDRPETWITSMFLHGSIMHLVGNMLFLWIYGDNLEDEMGHTPFLLFYLASGLAAGGAQVWSEPLSPVPMVGASGAIAGVMGGYLLMYPKARVDILIFLVVIIRIIPVPAWIVLLSWFIIQLAQGSLTPTDGGGVAYWAHAGGFAAGLLLTIPVWLRRGGPRFWRRTEGHPPHPDARYRYVKTDVPNVARRQQSQRPWGR